LAICDASGPTEESLRSPYCLDAVLDAYNAVCTFGMLGALAFGVCAAEVYTFMTYT